MSDYNRLADEAAYFDAFEAGRDSGRRDVMSTLDDIEEEIKLMQQQGFGDCSGEYVLKVVLERIQTLRR